MKYFIIAGEKSGDLHASNLAKELQAIDPQAQIRGWGGESMQAAGVEVLRHYNDMAFMGFWEVIKNLPTIRRFLKECQQQIKDFHPDAVILVDYGGFNMKVAEFCHRDGFRTFYYISPKVWAWNTGRAYKIKRLIEHMFVIFPFEKEFYARFGYEVDYVGNPIMDAIASHRRDEHFLTKNQIDAKRPIIALLPGSRRQELKLLLPEMVEVSHRFPDYQFVVAGISHLPQEWYAACRSNPAIRLVYDATYDLLSHAHAALVTSGTATLETALFGVPEVVVYKAGWLNYHIAKAVAKVNYISLVNIVMGREVVPELIQNDCNPNDIHRHLQEILHGDKRKRMLDDYASLRELLGAPGASKRTASLIWQYLQETK
ncbi:lipid-A-disaccharide synthase [Thermonema lapsum]|uniref:Lipid-A-disaccharide synthase n=1 Tax=Thermonema lapsum TaxID=28195 RepID=A0A846MNN2_9BACT|nr:lipid-A-disaccharide synthase [Thermonema lapsum]NIK73079.1 lipid-A-disaccharide synthase [Thermonema lapsum]